MKSILGTLKGKILLIGMAVLVIVAVVIGAVLLLSKEDSYRSIAVNQLEGTTLIKSKQDEIEAYKGMHLNSGDDVTVQKESNLTLLMDANKYLYAEAGTHFEVECVDGEQSGKKVIHLKEGSVLIRLKTALKDGEIYEVETPTGTMSVRGTVFRISVNKDTDDVIHTGIEVFDGKVQVDLQNGNGEYNSVSDTFEAGEAGAIIGDNEASEFVIGEDGTNKWEIDYKELPQDVAEVLVGYIDDGEELSIEKELLMDYTELTEHKMETINGKEATCTEDGYREVVCVVCDEVAETVIIPATGHTMSEWEIIKEPTCIKEGVRKRSCTVCETYIEEEEIPALGHTEGEMQIVKEANCTEGGLSQQLCTTCKEVLTSTSTQALGHSFGDFSVKKEANCTTVGTQVRTCVRCNTEETQSIASLGHSYGNWSVQTNATCTKTGVEVRTCSTCGATENREIAALGHMLSANHEHQDLVREGTDYVSCTCITKCTREGCSESVSVAATVSSEILGIMVQYFCNNCGDQI